MDGYRLHGLNIASELPLGEAVALEGEPDVAIRWAGEPVTPHADAEHVGGTLDPERRFFELHADAGGWTLRALPVDFAARLHRDLRHVEVSASSEHRELASVIAGGAVLGLLLDLRGEIALHASAVAVDGEALAFTGPVGAGKTTVAALTCAAGALLVADDLLRIALEPERALCHRGADALRLRDHAAGLADAPGVLGATRTPDDRTALRFAVPQEELLPLRAIVLPLPTRDVTEVMVERVPRTRATAVLAASARFASWHARDAIAAQFHRAADLEPRVPLFTARLPWGHPPPLEVGEELLAELARA